MTTKGWQCVSPASHPARQLSPGCVPRRGTAQLPFGAFSHQRQGRCLSALREKKTHLQYYSTCIINRSSVSNGNLDAAPVFLVSFHLNHFFKIDGGIGFTWAGFGSSGAVGGLLWEAARGFLRVRQGQFQPAPGLTQRRPGLSHQ